MGAMLCRRVLVVAIVGILGVLAAAPVASAGTYTVNDPTDAPLATSTSTSCASTNGGTCTLRAAVQAANNAGGASTISVAANTYKLTIPPADYHSVPACTTQFTFNGDGCDSNDPAHGDFDVLNGTTLTITGAGSASTTIDGNGVDRAFAVQSGGSLSLSKITIQNGQPAYGPYCFSTNSATSYDCAPSSGVGSDAVGGAIYSDGALAMTGDVTLRGNQAPVNQFSQGFGGAIYADSNTTALSLSGAVFSVNYAPTGSALYDTAPVAGTISGSTFSQNDTAGGNGTITGQSASAHQPSLSITGSTFSENIAGNGGAIYWNSPGDLTADGNTFIGNSAAAGGVLYNNFYNHPTSLSHDIIKNNSAFDAGVIYQNDSYSPNSIVDSVTLNNDEIDGNSATYVGVGSFASGAGPTSANSSYVGNSGADGGVFYLSDTSTYGGSSLTNVTMSGNSSNYGGAMYVSNSAANPLTMVNDTIAFNTASVAAGGIYGARYATPGGSGGLTNTIVAQNSGGDCAGVGGSQFTAAEDSGYNADSDGSCFGYAGHPSSDKVGVNTALNPAADNGGPNHVQTDAEHSSSPTVNAGNNAACPTTDARGLTRPQTAANICDIGAFEVVSAALSLANTAPSSATANEPFNETITAFGAGGGPSTGTIVVDQLPAGETLYGATPSQGSCVTSISPARVSCQLGLLATGSSATVRLVVAEANAGAVTNTATVTNDEGSSQSAAATTQVATAGALGTAPVAYTGPAGAVTKTIATLTGVVVPGGQPTGFFFDYGPSSRYGETTSVAHTGAAQEVVLAALAHLSSSTTYHYRLVAINDSGTSYGHDAKFKTKGTSPGRLLLGSRRFAVKGGMVFVPLTCASSKRCLGALSIDTRVKMTAASPAKTVVCTASSSAKYRIGAHKRRMLKVPLGATCVQVLAAGGQLKVRVAVTSRSGQRGLVELATVFRK
ncbi:MAG: hypothetical protein M3065_05765 [Actinomycetota bacterium]|nr:hypothetical protein [Actinomycetota bacterium]